MVLTPLTNENQLCTRGILRSDKLHAVLPPPLPSVHSVKQTAYCYTFASTRCLQIPFGHINWMPLDYAVCSTLYDKQNRAPEKTPFYYVMGLSWFRRLVAALHPSIPYHSGICRVYVALGQDFFPFACISPIMVIPVIFHIHSLPH